MFGEENNLIYHLPFHPALNEIVTRLETTSQHTILSLLVGARKLQFDFPVHPSQLEVWLQLSLMVSASG